MVMDNMDLWVQLVQLESLSNPQMHRLDILVHNYRMQSARLHDILHCDHMLQHMDQHIFHLRKLYLVSNQNE